jgi:hypothetical protein
MVRRNQPRRVSTPLAAVASVMIKRLYVESLLEADA